VNWAKIQQKYTQVQFIFLPENISLAAFDIGLSISKGNIIWRTDDDSNPRDSNAFDKVINILHKHPEIDIIATEILEPLNNNNLMEWYPLKVDKYNVPEIGYKSNTFMGGGAAIRKKVFDTIGSFWGFGYEELDFSARAIIAGFNIKYYPNILVDHYCSKNNRNRPERLVLMAIKQTRYHSKYFNFFKSFGRLFILLLFQNLEAISITRNPKIFWNLNYGMISTFFKTRKNERVKVKSELIPDITLNENMFFGVFRYFKIRFRRYMSRKTT
jgi:GT2 family glycosyltransferase